MKWIGIFALVIVLMMTIPFQSKETEKVELDQNENIFNVEWLQEQVEERRELELAKQQENKDEAQLSKEILLMARVIQAEALGEGYEGMVAVGSVIMNRAGRDINNVTKVIYKKNAFSSVSRGNRLFNARSINEDCIKAAIEVINGVDNVDGATNFLNPRYANPSWTKKLVKVRTIGNHTFYKYK